MPGYNEINQNILALEEMDLKYYIIGLLGALPQKKRKYIKNDDPKSLLALGIIRDAFGLPNGVLPLRSMTDAQIAEMIPLFRGAIAIVEALIRQIETDQA